MTTKVIVDAHAGWPVRVILKDTYGDRDTVETTETVEPGTERTFYATSSRVIVVEELSKPASG
jgi:hypothetical protein